MQHLYTEINGYGIERQNLLLGEERRELPSLRDGRAIGAREWLDRATGWLVDQLSYLGKNLPCIDNELACDMQFAQ